MTHEAAEAEFSRIIFLARLGKEGEEHHIEGTAEECASLAQRFGIVSLDRLCADVMVRPSGERGGVKLTGTFEADVVQSCVITQEPVVTSVKEAFNWLFRPEAKEENGVPGEELVLSHVEETEPLEGEELDMGECVAQYLGLALDPYPRLPDAQLPPELMGNAGTGAGKEETSESPFSALQVLKNRR